MTGVPTTGVQMLCTVILPSRVYLSSRTAQGTYQTQVLLRFCRQETSCYQDDYYPKQCYVKVNGQYCPIPVSIATGAWVISNLGLHSSCLVCKYSLLIGQNIVCPCVGPFRDVLLVCWDWDKPASSTQLLSLAVRKRENPWEQRLVVSCSRQQLTQPLLVCFCPNTDVTFARWHCDISSVTWLNLGVSLHVVWNEHI